MTEREPTTPLHFSWLKESGLYLFLASSYGIVLTYIYELGICNGYQLPNYLINLTNESLLLGIGTALLSIILYIIFITPILLWLMDSKYKFASEIAYSLISISIPLFIGINSGFDTPSFKGSLTFIFMMLLTRWQITSGNNPLSTKEDYDEQAYKLHFGLLAKLPKKYSLLIYFPIIFLAFIYIFGLNQAFGKKDRAIFYSESTHTCLIAKRFAESFVCIELDSNKNKITKTWHLIPTTNIKLTTRPLRLAQDSVE